MTKPQSHAGAYPMWTPDEDARLLSACEGRPIYGEQFWREIAQTFPGRSLCAARQRYLTLRQKAAGISRAPRQRERILKGRPRRMPTPKQQPRPRQNLEHATITAAFFGDPLPGRSALDQKRSASA